MLRGRNLNLLNSVIRSFWRYYFNMVIHIIERILFLAKYSHIFHHTDECSSDSKMSSALAKWSKMCIWIWWNLPFRLFTKMCWYTWVNLQFNVYKWWAKFQLVRYNNRVAFWLQYSMRFRCYFMYYQSLNILTESLHGIIEVLEDETWKYICL